MSFCRYFSALLTLLSLTQVARAEFGIPPPPPEFLGDIYTYYAVETLIWHRDDPNGPRSGMSFDEQLYLAFEDRLQTPDHIYLAASVLANQKFINAELKELHWICQNHPPREDDYSYRNHCFYGENWETPLLVQEAMDLAEKAFRARPKSMAGSSVLSALGDFLTHQGRTNEGIRVFKRSLEMIPPEAEAELTESKMDMALAYANPLLSETLRRQAITYLQESIAWYRKQNGDYYKGQVLMTNYNLGISHLFLFKDYPSAIEAFKQALNHELIDIDARVFLAFSYAKAGQHPAAREILKTIHLEEKVDPERSAFLHCYQDLTLLVLGDKSSVQSCLKLENPQVDVLMNLTDTLSQLQLPAQDENRWWRIFYSSFTKNMLPDIQRTIESASSEAELVREKAESRLKDLKLQNLSLYQYLVAALGGLAVLLGIAGSMTWKARAGAQLHATAMNRERARLQNILDSIEEGIFLISPNLSMQAEESNHLKSILGRHFTQHMKLDDFLKLSTLPADVQATILSCISASMGEPTFAWELNQGNLVKDLCLGGKFLALYWQPVFVNDQLQSIFLALRDVSDIHLLEEANARAQKDADRVLIYVKQILKGNTQAVMKFLNDLPWLLTKTQEEMDRKNYAGAMRSVHTIKGSARSLDLGELRESAHALEEQLQKALEVPIEDAWTATKAIARLYLSAKQFVTEDNHQTATDIFHIISNLRIGIENQLLDAGLTVGEIEVKESGRLTNAEYEKVQEILLHGLTNATDHGFIIPAKAGHSIQKPQFSVELQTRNQQRILKVRDNGIGIQQASLKILAEARGWQPEPGGLWSDFLFTDGVTTAESVTISSGRGVGLSAIKQAAQSMGGQVRLLANENRVGTLLQVTWMAPEEPEQSHDLLNQAS